MKPPKPLKVSPLWRRLLCSLWCGSPRLWNQRGDVTVFRCLQCGTNHKRGA